MSLLNDVIDIDYAIEQEEKQLIDLCAIRIELKRRPRSELARQEATGYK